MLFDHKPAVPPPPRKDVIRDDKEVREHLDVLARAREQEARDRQEALFALATTSHKADVDAYVLDCSRWGDFLALFLARGVYDHKAEDGFYVRKHATSINLGLVKQIQVKQGNLPDNEGTLYYEYSLEETGESKEPRPAATVGRDYSYSYGLLPKAPKGYRYIVIPKYPRIQRIRKLVVDHDDKSVGNGYGLRSASIVDYTTGKYVRVARDDEIQFLGAGISVCTPAGTGEAMRDKILKEIRAGSKTIITIKMPAVEEK